MTKATTFHIEIEEETDLTHRFFYTNYSTGLPVDLEGYRAEMHVVAGYEGSDRAELKYTSEEGGGIVLGGAAGTVDLFISYEDTRGALWNRGSYRLVLISPQGTRIPLVKGFFTVIKSVMKLEYTALPDISEDHSGYTEPNNLDLGGLNKVVPEVEPG